MQASKTVVTVLAAIIILSAALQTVNSLEKPTTVGHAITVSEDGDVETSLQEWLTLNGFNINVTTDETAIETFEKGAYRVEILTELASYAANNSLGWYALSSGEQHQIFSGDNATGDTTLFQASEQFGLYLSTPNGTFYTETARNPDSFDHAWVFINPENHGYIIAWEDLIEGGDLDFQDMVLAMLVPTIDAEIEIHPETLCLKSRGRWVTCYIQLKGDYDVRSINVSTIMLNQTIHAEAYPVRICDYDCDGVVELIVKFSRRELIKLIRSNVTLHHNGCRKTVVTLLVEGSLHDGTVFRGSDTINVIHLTMHRCRVKRP